MELFKVFATLGLDTKGFDKKMQSATKAGREFASTIGKGIGKTLKTIGKAGTVLATGAAAATGVLAKIGFDYNAEMETYTTNFEVMLGSEEEAIKKVDELKKFAASTPLSMADLAQGTQTLLAFGVASDDTTLRLRQLGDISLGNADKMQSLATAFGKASAQGKVTGDTVQMMIDAGWNPLIQISQRTGESMEELQKRMSQGKVSVEELEQAMADATTEGMGPFAGGMEKASHTTVGLISTLKDNVSALIGEVFTPLSNYVKDTLLPGAITAVDTLTTAYHEGGISGMINAAVDMVQSFFSSLWATFEEKFPEWAAFFESIFGVVEAVLEPIGIAIQNIKQWADENDVLNVTLTALTEAFNWLAETLSESFSGWGEFIEYLKTGKVEGDAAKETLFKVVEVIGSVIAVLGTLISVMTVVNLVMTANPIGLLITALASLVIAIGWVIANWETVKTKAKELWDKLTEYWEQIKQTAKDLWDETYDNVVQPCIDAYNDVVQWFSDTYEDVKQWWEDTKDKAEELWDKIESAVVDPIEEAYNSVCEWVEDTYDDVVEFWDELKTAAEEKWDGIKSAVVDPIIEAYQSVVGWVSTAYTNVTGWFQDTWDKAVEIWDGIKESITGPIDEAKEFVEGIVEDIKGFFDFEFKWPNIPLPHLTLSPKGWKVGDIFDGSFPKIGIDWYAKAMGHGMILDKPTVFGYDYDSGQFLGAGEAGSETIVGTRSLTQMISAAVAAGMPVNLLIEILQQLKLMNEQMPDVMADAMSEVEVSIDQRKFARAVREV